ncbi:MAG: hypothetical protein E6R04_01065 [Spirochaetes bacterium]|nr:MAG: hypothetical protein E6R04_01065 [Spirochaetota bacterium]
MSDICSVCKSDKQENELATSPSTGRKLKVCLVCWGKHYAHLAKPADYHKQKRKRENRASRKKQIARNREYIASILLDSKCMDCGYSNWIALELDHRNPTEKHDAVTRMVNDGVMLERIKAEVAKCDVVCANCHAIRTAKQFNSWRVGFIGG